jgi:serine protease
VTPPAGSATGLGTYSVTVNDAALAAAPGLYSAKITFSSTTTGVTPIQVAVTIEVGGANSSAGTVGVLYFLLADATTLQEVPGQTVMVAQSVSGGYAYRFTGVAPGRYYVFAGTDLNNDGFICDAGEACGGNPTLDRLAEVVVSNANLTNLNFPVGFARQLGAASTGMSRAVGKRMAR